jgi:hypothetical protein
MKTVLLLLSLLLGSVPRADGEAWKYVVPEASASHRCPSLLVLPLSDEAPGDVTGEVVELEGVSFGQIRYGDPDSVRVTVAFDADGARLWVDADRDRALTERDRVPVRDGEWIVELAISTKLEEETLLVPRMVRFKHNRTLGGLSYATLGYLEGSVRIDDEVRGARRIDGNGDGFVTGERDGLWLDLDGDGSWSIFREHFLFAPVVHVGGERYKLRSDRLGTHLATERIDGTGRIRLDFGERDVTSLQVLLASSDGCVATVRSIGESIEVPVGEYRIDMVTLLLADPDGGLGWVYVFSGTGRGRHLVEKDAEVTIDPLGTPTLGFRGDGSVVLPAEGERLSVTPWLATEDGLLANSVDRGTKKARYRRGAAEAKVRFLNADGRILATKLSGFS